jgi:spectinomycin phosphotransferase
MLEKPDIQEEKIIACIQAEYGLQIGQFDFLPLGADINTAVYRAVSLGGTAYFIKLRRGNMELPAVLLPELLSNQGIRQVIPPRRNLKGQLFTQFEPFNLILYPYIEGRNGYETDLSDQQWIDLGKALYQIHAAPIPGALMSQIQVETYSPNARQSVKSTLEQVDVDTYKDPVAGELAAFLKTRRAEILILIRRAESLALELQKRPPECTVCHSDIHAGNILIDNANNIYLVDWDNPIRAPKERDLMFAGGGQFGNIRLPQEEERLFYLGYGKTQVDQVALAYYRYERILQDIAAFCELLLLSDEGGQDREQSFQYLRSCFLPGGTIEIAFQTDHSGII